MTKSSEKRQSQKKAQKEQKRKEKRQIKLTVLQSKGPSRPQKESPSSEKQVPVTQPTDDARFRAVALAVDTIWQNQVALQAAHRQLDDQFSVLTRLSVSAFNELSLRVFGDDADPISAEVINSLFAEWEEFKKRPDFRKHMKVWMVGGDLSSLPPPNGEAPSAEPNREPTEFGGDYAEGCCPSESSDSEGNECSCGSNEEDPVPVGQDTDSHDRGGTEVPDLSKNLPESETLAASL